MLGFIIDGCYGDRFPMNAKNVMNILEQPIYGSNNVSSLDNVILIILVNFFSPVLSYFFHVCQ